MPDKPKIVDPGNGDIVQFPASMPDSAIDVILRQKYAPMPGSDIPTAAETQIPKSPGLLSGGGPVGQDESLTHAVLRQALGGVGRGISGLATAPYQVGKAALQPPQNPEEQVAGAVPGGLLAKRLVADPLKAQYQRAKSGDIGGITELATMAAVPEAAARGIGKLAEVDYGSRATDTLTNVVPKESVKAQAAFKNSLTRAMPDLKPTLQQLHEAGTPVQDIQSAVDAVHQAQGKVWKDFEASKPQGIGKTMVPGDTVADAIDRARPSNISGQLDPQTNLRIAKDADVYRGRSFTVEDLQNRLREANNDLETYAASNQLKKEVASQTPRGRAILNEVGAIRDLLNQAMKDRPEYMQRYGALEDVRKGLVSLADSTRSTRAVRPDTPIGMAAKLVSPTRYNQLQQFLQGRQMPDFKVRQAFNDIRRSR